MPLNTQVLRDGETVKIPGGWDAMALNAFLNAAYRETSPGLVIASSGETFAELELRNAVVDLSMAPIYYMTGADVIEKGRQTLTRDHTFVSDDEARTIELKAGDVLRAWRD